jgi:hypothetical protein
MERSVLDAVPVDLPDVKVFLYLLDSTRDYVVSSTPNTITFRFALLLAVRLIISCSRKDWLTLSSKASQNDLSISVTTLPGASGVPRWSSLNTAIF